MWTTGGALCRVELFNTRTSSQHTRQGEQMRTENKQKGLEGNIHGKRDQAGVTERPDGAGGRAEVGPLSATSGEYGCGVPTGDYSDTGNTHPTWRRIQRLSDGGGELVLGRSLISLESGKGMSGGGHGQL